MRFQKLMNKELESILCLFTKVVRNSVTHSKVAWFCIRKSMSKGQFILAVRHLSVDSNKPEDPVKSKALSLCFPSLFMVMLPCLIDTEVSCKEQERTELCARFFEIQIIDLDKDGPLFKGGSSGKD